MTERMKELIFLFKVKWYGGIASSWLNGKPHCAKWVNTYAKFLNDEEKEMFRKLVANGTLWEQGEEVSPANRCHSDFNYRPIYKS